MAPKRRPAARTVKTVVTTKKVVEETVKVVVTPGGDGSNEKVELISSSTQENQNIQVSTPSPRTSPRTIPIQDKSTPPPPEPDDDDETQPVSEPETPPTPPEEKKKAAGKRKAGGGAVKRPRKRGGGGGGGEGYKRYVLKVMKQVHPGMGISRKTMTIMDNLMGDMFGRLAEEAGQLLKHTGRRTMTSREVQGAVKLVLPGELGKHAIAEGTKAVSNYVSYVSAKK